MAARVALAALAIGTTTRAADGGDEDSLRAAGLLSRRATTWVRTLTDEAGPRPAGSLGDRIALGWAERAMAEAGLERIRREPVKVPAWHRESEAAFLLTPHGSERRLVATALGGSPPTAAGGITAEVVAFASLDALKAAPPAQVAGKIAFVAAETRRMRDGSGYGSTVNSRWLGPTIAKEKGAAALLIRSVGTGNDRLAHTGSTKREAVGLSVPSAALSVPDAEYVQRAIAMADGKTPVRVRLELQCGWRGDAMSANVVGELPGTGQGIVLMGAHLDSWDLGTGALDDGAGVAIALESARLVRQFGGNRLHTLRVVLFANEENGLSGAEAYAAAHAAELPNHVLAMEADAGTGAVYEARFGGTDDGRPSFEWVTAPLERLGIARGSSRAHGGADVSPLRKLGVPVIDLQQDMSTYFDVHHTVNDVFERIDPPALAQASTAFALVLRRALGRAEGFGRASGPAQPEGFGRNVTAPTPPAAK